jgi:hypothetical protein
MDIWQEVAMDSLKFCPGPPCLTLLRPETAITGVARPQSVRPVAIFYPLRQWIVDTPLNTVLFVTGFS